MMPPVPQWYISTEQVDNVRGVERTYRISIEYRKPVQVRRLCHHPAIYHCHCICSCCPAMHPLKPVLLSASSPRLSLPSWTSCCLHLVVRAPSHLLPPLLPRTARLGACC